MNNPVLITANTIRGLAADMVEKAKSGHPGMPLGTADLAAVLFSEFLRHDPLNPGWPDRDRFVLSAGHGSTLLYSLLYLTGYPLPFEELQRFRQWGSKTPGHPEWGVTPGVETTTGPLGQGISNAVGMALAERMLAARFNRPGFEIVDHYTYAISGDGCLMEGISSEASSLAGDLKLGKLIVFYDDNDISIEGSTDLAFKENVAARYKAYGWQVIEVNGHDLEQIRGALKEAKTDSSRPTLIIAHTAIAKGSPLEGNAEAHGAPLGKENIAALKRNLGLPEQEFFVPEEVKEYFASRRTAWQKDRQTWETNFDTWSKQFPELRREWDRIMARELPADLETALPRFEPGSASASRDAGGKTLNALAAKISELVGGSADLSPSTKTNLKDAPAVHAGNYEGRNLHFGIREHAMGAILNGMSLHGGFRVYGSTFLVFSDYMRTPVRLAALMKQPVVFVFTHDSFWVGEDGPTHEPVEQIESLRLIPGLRVIRPADGNETAWAWLEALRDTEHPSALILTRQKLPTLSGATLNGFRHGGYTIKEADGGNPDLVILATGSEVALAVDAAAQLGRIGKKARVVSVPCRELFVEQGPAYLKEILGTNLPTVAVEAGTGSGWYRLVGREGLVISIDHFGASAPAEKLAQEFGFTPEAVTQKIRTHFNW
ncbi:MAG TPA: transketolase [Bacillota bacterium]